MSLLDKSIKRRDFLKVSAGAAAAMAVLGSAEIARADDAPTSHAGYDEVAHDAEVINGTGEWLPIHCHQNCNQMCMNRGYVVDGVVVRQKTDDWHEDSFDRPQQRGCLRGRSLRQQVYNADRIKYPMKRKSWQPGGGENAHGELRGKDEWERITWDEALTYITDEMKRVYKEYGKEGMICNGWRWAPGSAMYWLQNAKANGTNFVYVGPDKNVSASMIGARWIQVRPGTDTALLLAVMYEMLRLDGQPHRARTARRSGSLRPRTRIEIRTPARCSEPACTTGREARPTS